MLCNLFMIRSVSPLQNAETEHLGNVSIAEGNLSSVPALFISLEFPTVRNLGAQGALHVQPMHGCLIANSAKRDPSLKVSEPGHRQ